MNFNKTIMVVSVALAGFIFLGCQGGDRKSVV